MQHLRKPFKRKWMATLYQFSLREKIAFRIMFKEKHLIAIYFTGQDLEDLITDNELKSEGINISFAGCMEHHGLKVVKEVAAMVDDVDIICCKAEFEVEVGKILKNKKLNDD